MVVFETVKADGDGVHATVQKGVEPFLVEEVAVGYEAPGEAPAVEFSAYGFDVGAKESFSAGEDDEGFVGVYMGGDVVYGFEEVFGGHIGGEVGDFAVAPAMAAIHVATQGALPKEGAQGV